MILVLQTKPGHIHPLCRLEIVVRTPFSTLQGLQSSWLAAAGSLARVRAKASGGWGSEEGSGLGFRVPDQPVGHQLASDCHTPAGFLLTSCTRADYD